MTIQHTDKLTCNLNDLTWSKTFKTVNIGQQNNQNGRFKNYMGSYEDKFAIPVDKSV